MKFRKINSRFWTAPIRPTVRSALFFQSPIYPTWKFLSIPFSSRNSQKFILYEKFLLFNSLHTLRTLLTRGLCLSDRSSNIFSNLLKSDSTRTVRKESYLQDLSFHLKAPPYVLLSNYFSFLTSLWMVLNYSYFYCFSLCLVWVSSLLSYEMSFIFRDLIQNSFGKIRHKLL